LIFKEKDYLKKAIDDIISSREALQKKLSVLAANMPGKLKVLQSSANFVLVETVYADAVFEDLSNRDIKVRKFPGLLRITAGSNEENEKLIAAMADIMNNC